MLSARVLSAQQGEDGVWYLDCAWSGHFSDEALRDLL
jgi:hypothetical protein